MTSKVSLVAGASRGVGRGIALGFAETGAAVVASARSSEAGPRTEGRSEVVEDTAREIETLGGKGYPYVCDHTSEREVDGLVSWTLRRFGRIDVAVCAVWAGNEGFDGARFPDGSTWGTPFWRRPAGLATRFHEGGVLPALLLARAVAPAMVSAGRGLIVFVSFDTAPGYLGDVFYDGAKHALNRLGFACAQELAPHGVTALTLSPGHVATERVREAGAAHEATETPLFVGRAVAALAADPDVARHAGRVVATADLAREYGFTDVDGRLPTRFDPMS